MKWQYFLSRGLLLFAGVVIVPALAIAQEAVSTETELSSVLLMDAVVAGGEKDFMEVRHIVLKGSNQEIGQALATIAKDRFHVQPMISDDSIRTRAQRRYIERNYPILHDRMRGVAAAFKKQVDDDGFNFSVLFYPTDFKGGCSVVYYPPTVTATGNGIVSRNYDFTTGTLRGTQPTDGELASTARPYIVEMYPDTGYASLAVYSYDLLSGVLDGINSQGLTVALLADDETVQKFSMEPAGMDAAGQGEVQMLRLLLDTCASTEEAKETLLMTKKSYSFNPVHYLVADRHGNGFVWEFSQHRNREYFIENPNKPLITTNFSLHRYMEENVPPSASKVQEVCHRYCKISELVANRPNKLTENEIKEAHKTADLVGTANLLPRPGPPARTLWHALYSPNDLEMQISFYLRDEPASTNNAEPQIIRTEYLKFSLDKTKVSR